MEVEIPLALWALVAGIIVLAGVVHGTLGLGFPLVATPLLALVLDVRLAILLTLAPTAAVNVASILRGTGWRATLGRFWPLAASAVLGALAGARALVVLDPAPFKLLLAALIVGYLLVTRRRELSMAWVARHRLAAMLAFGLAAGVAAGTTNVMVPVLIIYSLQLALPRAEAVRMFNFCFLCGKLSQIGVFASAGLLGGSAVAATAALAVVALAALRAGMAIGDRIDRDTYTRWVRRVLALLAALLTAQFLAAALALG